MSESRNTHFFFCGWCLLQIGYMRFKGVVLCENNSVSQMTSEGVWDSKNKTKKSLSVYTYGIRDVFDVSLCISLSPKVRTLPSIDWGSCVLRSVSNLTTPNARMALIYFTPHNKIPNIPSLSLMFLIRRRKKKHIPKHNSTCKSLTKRSSARHASCRINIQVPKRERLRFAGVFLA